MILLLLITVNLFNTSRTQRACRTTDIPLEFTSLCRVRDKTCVVYSVIRGP